MVSEATALPTEPQPLPKSHGYLSSYSVLIFLLNWFHIQGSAKELKFVKDESCSSLALKIGLDDFADFNFLLKDCASTTNSVTRFVKNLELWQFF